MASLEKLFRRRQFAKKLIGIQTGNWKPLRLEVEAIAAGTLAAYATGVLFAGLLALLSTPVILSTVIVAILMALAASYFDSETVDEINDHIINSFQNKSERPLQI